MQLGTTLVILLVAALLEAGGDAIVRHGLHTPSARTRMASFVAGAAVLFAYGYVVNRPPWDFGRLLGVYVVFFFLVAQAINWLVFGQPPTRGVWLGGALIVAGGIVVARAAN
jgi:small multidrug resistance family-3 protein